MTSSREKRKRRPTAKAKATTATISARKQTPGANQKKLASQQKRRAVDYYTKAEAEMDSQKKYKLFFNAAKNGHLASQVAVYVLHYINDKPTAPYDHDTIYQIALEHGRGVDQKYIGRIYDVNNDNGVKGWVVPKDLAKAALLYKLAADKGDAQAQWYLGEMYANGNGVKTDRSSAARYYTLAADQGLPYAQWSLGVVYNYGDGVAKDLHKAAQLYQLAANQGDCYAQRSLGIMFEDGLGVETDAGRAAELYEQAACGQAGILAEVAQIYKVAADEGDAHAIRCLVVLDGK
jgi:TPR repeat protein